MKTLHDDAQGNKPSTPPATDFPRVRHLQELLGTDVLMLAWPKGKKGTAKAWGHLTVAKMSEPAYLHVLEKGNIGIAQGEKSNGLCSIDLDTEKWMRAFLEINPSLRSSLRTRGQSGCNIWVRVRGKYPKSFKLQDATGKTPKEREPGEWRANGNQTIISGQHPSGCAYSPIVEAPPVEIEYKDIHWPKGLRVPQVEDELPIAHSALSDTALSVTQRSQSHSSPSPLSSLKSVLSVLSHSMFRLSSPPNADRQTRSSGLWLDA